MRQDFSKAKIYKITNDHNDDVYVGSTCDTLVKRFSIHKSVSKREVYKDRALYKLINEIGFNRFRIELIEDYPCSDLYQLRQREGYYIRTLGTLNLLIAGRDGKQYRDEHKEEMKQYRIENKEKIAATTKEYQEKNKDRIKQVKKHYREENKTQIAEYNKNYRENNKEIFFEQNHKRTTCECGCEILKRLLNRHMKSKKHVELMQQKTGNII